MSKQYITASAYLDELQSWQNALKLLIKQISLLQKSSDISKSFQTDIQILITEIQSQLLKYRREKTRVMSASENINQFTNIIGNFQNCNDKFNELVERGNEIIEELSMNSNENKRTADLNYITNRGEKVQNKTQRTKSRFQSTTKDKGKNITLNIIQRKSIKSFQQSSKQKQRKKQSSKTISLFQSPDSQLKLQFVAMKKNLLQIHKLIDTHEHPLLEQEIKKLKLSNNKILMDIRMLKEEHAYMQNQIFELKKEVNDERKQDNLRQKKDRVQQRVQLKAAGDMPEWVRMRVKNRN